MSTYTEQDFEQLEFHDHCLRGMLIRTDFESGVSNLVLDIDYIADQWGVPSPEYMVAAADFTFHGVTGLKFSMDWLDNRYQVCAPGDYIVDLTRRPVVPQLVHRDRPYWRWELTFAGRTELSFGAYGFTLTLRQSPVRYHESCLPLKMRS